MFFIDIYNHWKLYLKHKNWTNNKSLLFYFIGPHFSLKCSKKPVFHREKSGKADTYVTAVCTYVTRDRYHHRETIMDYYYILHT